MIALIIKELRYYTHRTKYRRAQFVVLSFLALVLLATAFELFALSQKQPQIRVGESIYTILVPLFFCLLLGCAVPLQVVESLQIERQNANADLLNLTPIGYRKVLLGKLIGALIATSWYVWLAVPLFGLSVYTGGLGPYQLFQCSVIFVTGFTLFFLVGISLTLFGSPTHAMARSYAVVLLITFSPLVLTPSQQWLPWLAPLLRSPTVLFDILRALSPLCVLIAIVTLDADGPFGIGPIWLWMLLCYTVLSVLLFGVCSRRLAKRGLSNLSKSDCYS